MEKKEYEFCKRCGRKLRSEKAREEGYGAVCKRKVSVEQTKRLFNNSAQLHSSTLQTEEQ